MQTQNVRSLSDHLLVIGPKLMDQQILNVLVLLSNLLHAYKYIHDNINITDI